MSVVLFLVILVVLIVGHELGHLVIAKWSGMRVPEFGVGFPPKLWGLRVGETEYTLNALPLGGFVKIIGEDHEHTDDPDSFVHKPKYAQAGVLVAGPLMNVLLGFVAFWIAFGIGVPSAVEEGNTPPPNARVVVSQVLPGGPADMAGVRVGDILANLESPTALADLVSANPGGVQLEVARGDEVFSIALTPAPNIIPDEPEKLAVGIGSLLVANESFGFFESLVRAIEATGTGLVSIVLGFASLIAGVFTSGASLESLAGPVGIAGLVGDAATFGIGQVLILTAVISLNLAVLNLLPFPALDGGRLLFLMIEVVRGRAISPRVAGAVNAGGFALLILLMLVVTWNDIENF